MNKASKINTPPIPVFRKLMDTTPNVTRADLAKYLGVSAVAIGQYYNGDALPSMDNLIKIAKYFNVSTDYLLGLTDVKTTDTDLKMIVDYTGLSEECINELRKMQETIASFDSEDVRHLLWNESAGIFLDKTLEIHKLIQPQFISAVTNELLPTIIGYIMSVISSSALKERGKSDPAFFDTRIDRYLTYLMEDARCKADRLEVFEKMNEIMNIIKDKSLESVEQLCCELNEINERSGGNGKHKED